VLHCLSGYARIEAFREDPRASNPPNLYITIDGKVNHDTLSHAIPQTGRSSLKAPDFIGYFRETARKFDRCYLVTLIALAAGLR